MLTNLSRALGNGYQIPKTILIVLNQLYEMEQKLKNGAPANLRRHIDKMKDVFAEEGIPIPHPYAGGGQRQIGLAYEDPMGWWCKGTRTDLDATIAGANTENLIVVEVIKPIIRAMPKEGAAESYIVQKGIVIVKSQTE